MSTKQQGVRGVRWGLLLLTAALGLTTLHCALPTDPGIPTWDVPFAVPFSQARYGLDSLVSKPAEIDSNQSGIIIGENGELSFWFTDSIPKTQINPEDLTFTPETEEEFVVETDTIRIPDQGTRDASIAFADYVPGAGSMIVPAVDLPVAGDTLEFEGFDSLRVVHVADGEIDLTFANNTVVEWTLVVTMKANRSDLGFPVYGDPVTFTSIQPGASATETISLTNEDVYPEVLIEVTGSSPGSGGNIVTVGADDALDFQIHLKELQCDVVEAIIPEQDVVSEQYALALNQEDYIASALIDSGSIYFEVLNQTDIENYVHLVFPDFISVEDGDTLDFPLTLQANSDTVMTWDLADYELKLDLPTTEGEAQGIRARTTVTVLGTPVDHGPPFADDEFSSVRAGDTVKVKYYTGRLKFREFSGVPKNINLNVEEQSQDIEIFGDQMDIQQELAGNMLLDEVTINVHLNNAFDLPVRLLLNMDAYNSITSETVNQLYTVDLEPKDSLFTLDNVDTLINVLPDRIDFSVQVQAGRDYFQPSPPYEARTVTNTDSVEGIIEIVSPFTLVINDTTVLRPVPTAMQEPLTAPLRNATLVTAVANSVPVNGEIFLMAGSFETEEQARVELIRGNTQYYLMTPLDIPVPEIDPNSDTRPVAVDTLYTEIPEEGLNLLDQENVWIRQILVLYPTVDTEGNLVPVTMYPEDAITVTVLAEVTLIANEQDDSE